jgi:non-ribosomal peptide synthetase component F
VVLQKTPYSFDVSVWEFTWFFTVGARLVMAAVDGHKDPDYLINVVQQQKITTLHFVPSMLRIILANSGWSSCQSLRQVFCSGEALAVD